MNRSVVLFALASTPSQVQHGLQARRDDQLLGTMIGEFVKSPDPARTAVGTTCLLSDVGIIEVQLITEETGIGSGYEPRATPFARKWGVSPLR